MSTSPANGCARSHGRATSGKKASGTTAPDKRLTSGAISVFGPRSVSVAAITMLMTRVNAAESSTIASADAANQPAAASETGGGSPHLPSPTSGSSTAANRVISAALGSTRATDQANARMNHQA